MSEKKYCRLCKKKETRSQCGFGPKMWDRYSVDDATEKETEDAASEAGITEANKSGDSSLRDWFGKSKSSDGKPGWVQLGGKYAGKPCAKQPGQKTKPKCGSSKMKRNLDKDEEQAAFRRKQKEDPNPNRKGKAINVATEETKKDHEYSMARSQLKTIKKAAERLEKKMGKKGEGELKAWVQSKITKAADYIDTASDYVTNEELELMTEEQFDEAAGEKDACYHKVKSRYSVWPSAYASGALVKCRKVGAKNWGNKTKKEEFEFSNWRDDFRATEYEFVDLITAEEEMKEAKKCWPGYEKKGTKKMFGKTYNNCVKKEENEVEVSEAVRIPSMNGNMIHATVIWKGRYFLVKMFFPQLTKPKRAEVQAQIEKAYPGSRVASYHITDYKPGEQFLHVTEDWQKVNKKDKVDGMGDAAIKAYRRENPGSKLKGAVTGNPKKGSKDAKRRSSYCSRSEGQKDMHNIDCSKTPDKAICKARRRWKC